MNRNVLYLVIAVLAVLALILGYQYYQERQKPDGIKIEMGEDGISVETN
jgi:predicted negative regulator of RcsB-dependent stress response